MSRQRTAQDVPDAEVPALKAIWESEGATVTVKDNGDGTSDVTGVWPDASSDANVNAAAAHASAASAHASAASAHASAASAKASTKS